MNFITLVLRKNPILLDVGGFGFFLVGNPEVKDFHVVRHVGFVGHLKLKKQRVIFQMNGVEPDLNPVFFSFSFSELVPVLFQNLVAKVFQKIIGHQLAEKSQGLLRLKTFNRVSDWGIVAISQFKGIDVIGTGYRQRRRFFKWLGRFDSNQVGKLGNNLGLNNGIISSLNIVDLIRADQVAGFGIRYF
jgi:hypothetical protein